MLILLSRTTNLSTLTNSLPFFIRRRNPLRTTSFFSYLCCPSPWSDNWFVQVNLLKIPSCWSLMAFFKEILVQ
jgi:hypothetical protein